MIEAWANDIVVLLAGVTLGSIFSFIGATMPPRSSISDVPREPGEGYWAWQRRAGEVQRNAMADAPRSFVLASVAFYGFLFVFIGALLLSPLHMKWWFFLGGAALAIAVGHALPKLVSSGALPAATGESLTTAVRRALSGARSAEPPTQAPTASP